MKRKDFSVIQKGEKGQEARINLGKPTPLEYPKALAPIRRDSMGVESVTAVVKLLLDTGKLDMNADSKGELSQTPLS